MTLSDLTDCVVKVNDDGLIILEGEHRLSSALVTTTKAARVYRLSPPQGGGTLMRPGQARRCFEGVATAEEGNQTGDHGNPTALEKTISIGAPGPFHRVAVGAVIDIDGNKTNSDDIPTGAHADLPVVLAVGINYGQGSAYVGTPPVLFENTAMRPRADAVVLQLIKQGAGVQPLGVPYYLVAANFFPWITTKSWNACTSSVLTEELLLRYFGWPNPLDFVVALIRALQGRTAHLPANKGLTHVIFHGVHNATMRCGLALTGHLTRNHLLPPAKLPLYRCYSANPPVPPLIHCSRAWRHNLPGPDVIFCDNLAPPGIKFSNAVWLWQ